MSTVAVKHELLGRETLKKVLTHKGIDFNSRARTETLVELLRKKSTRPEVADKEDQFPGEH